MHATVCVHACMCMSVHELTYDVKDIDKSKFLDLHPSILRGRVSK